MVSMTLSIPEDLKSKMDKFPELNWSAVAREAIRKRIEMLEEFKEFSRESILTEEDAIELGRKVNAGIAKRHREACKAYKASR